MGVANVYPELRFKDTRPSLVSIPVGTSSASAIAWSRQSVPTEAQEHLQLLPGEAGSTFDLLISRAIENFGSAFLFITRGRTLTVSQDYEMSLLEAASSMGNEMTFVEVVNAIAWDYRSVEDFLKAIRLALSVGAHLQARKLAMEGGLRFAGHEEMQKYARILSPSQVLDAHLPPDTNAGADMKWLKTHGEEYRGQWVALRGGVLLAAAISRKKLLARLDDPKDKSLLITSVY